MLSDKQSSVAGRGSRLVWRSQGRVNGLIKRPVLVVTLYQYPVLGVCAQDSQGWSLAQLAHAGDVVCLVTWLPVAQPTTNYPSNKLYPSNKRYPLSQWVGYSDELASAHTAKGNTCVNEMVAEPTTSGDCVDQAQANISCEGFDVKMTYPNDTAGQESAESMAQYWEIEQGPDKQITIVQGRLKKHLSSWKEVLQAPPPVVECIEQGYWLPLKHLPSPYVHQNHSSTWTHRDFVEGAVRDLLANCCILKVEEQPVVCSPLSVVSSFTGKQRLVLNLRYSVLESIYACG